MRWWLNTDHKMFSVDNAGARGLDFSTLPPDVWMVQWTDGKGEIERQDANGNNLNGLREPFIDVAPYAPFFQQFMHLLPGLTLPQAKKVQTDLISVMYDSKRQLPYPKTVTAGNFTWPADDGSVAAMSLQVMPTIFDGIGAGAGSSNDLVTQINALVDQINDRLAAASQNDQTLLNDTNAMADSINSGVTAPGNALVSDFNSKVVTPANTALSQTNTAFSDTNGSFTQGNNIRDYINSDVIGVAGDTASGPNTISNKLRTNFADPPAGSPGLNGAIAAIPYSFTMVGQISTFLVGSSVGFGGFSHYGAIPNIQPVGHIVAPTPWTSTIAWIPIERTTPVNLTINEMVAIMSGIAARQQVLAGKRATKANEVNALTVIDDVIDYDVTTGW